MLESIGSLHPCVGRKAGTRVKPPPIGRFYRHFWLWPRVSLWLLLKGNVSIVPRIKVGVD